MKVEDLLVRLQTLSQMISQGRAGSPQQLADSWGCSKRSIIAHVNILRSLGQEIWFDRKTNSYKCSVKGKLEIRFVPEADIKSK